MYFTNSKKSKYFLYWTRLFIYCFPAIGQCEPGELPELAHGRKVAVKNFRGSVYKYVCDGDYKRVGQGQVHCAGGVWDLLHPPVCTSE